ncbi:hypothetical protein [Candidatus Rariloculus sp.]|uniref:hypothetical protein n=1 Tax=Candidatus Rariloculus sp. TaxID=3101265 RepID=UPI003D12C211
MGKRRNFSSNFKARVAVAANCGDGMIAELAALEGFLTLTPSAGERFQGFRHLSIEDK